MNSDGTIYKLLEYNLIEEAGKLDAPGRPTMYKTTITFLKMFGLTNLEELPELPRYKIDENEQIVIDDVIEEAQKEEINNSNIVNNETETVNIEHENNKQRNNEDEDDMQEDK